MMKSFFKKLAFVMALAMVVSMAAPAGSALAAGLSVAYQAGGTVSELNLKAGAEQDLKFLGAPKNWKDLGWSWTSSNEAVATVDAAGIVTAVADGTATITITVGSLSGSVTVNVGEAKAYDVTLGNADNKAMTTAELKKGAALDLNFYGVKDWNKNNYTVAWSVSGDAANVDKNGVVTAVKAGKAVVTASIVNNVTGVAHKVTPVEVTVAADVNKDAFTVAQKDTDKFVLTFNEAKTADQIRENLTVSVKIGDKDYPISFENIAVNGNEVTVVTYARFENDEVYTLAYGKETETYTIVLGDIASVGVNYYTGKDKENKIAYVTEEEENDYVTLIPVLYDKYGNDITAKYNLNNFSFSYVVSNNVAPQCVYNDTYAFDAAGLATVDVVAAWVTDNGEYKEASGQTSFVVQKRGSIGMSLVKAGIANTAKSTDDIFTYFTDPKTSFQMDPNSVVWNSASTSIMYKEVDTRPLVYTAVLKDNRGNVFTTNDVANAYIDAYRFGSFMYESTNNEVLSITDYTGEVEINGVGRANILVYFTPADGTESKKLVASTMITVTPETYPVSYKMVVAMGTQSAYTYNGLDAGLAKDSADLNDAAFKVQFIDQFGNPYRNDELVKYIKIEARDINNNVGIIDGKIEWEGWSNTYVFKLDASQFQADLGTNNSKTYSYKLSMEDADLTSTIKTPYTVFSLVVKNTYEEYLKLVEFIDEGTVEPNYKFNINFGDNHDVDVAVKNVIGYGNTGAQSLTKHTWWSTQADVIYMSSGNLKMSRVPVKYLVDVDAAEGKITTGHVGYVYYKVNAPSKTTVAGASVTNDDTYDVKLRNGVVDFYFNKKFDAVPEIPGDLILVEVESGKEVKFEINEKDRDQYSKAGNLYLPEKQTTLQNEATYSKGAFMKEKIAEGVKAYYDKAGGAGQFVEVKFVRAEPTPAKPASFKYSAAGNYTVSFATTRKEDAAIYNVATRTIKITNSQNQVKYLGLNPEFEGVTELKIPTGDYAYDTHYTALEAIVEEQLLFSYDELFLGDFYDKFDGYDGVTVKLSANQPKVQFARDGKSVTITALHFDVLLDDGDSATNDLYYTSVVSVGARIKAK